MPLLRSRTVVRRSRWKFMKVFFVAMGLMAALFSLIVLARVAMEWLPWA